MSGNWCWIRSKRLDLRYGLSHGWRIGIFVITIIIYTYIYVVLKTVFKSLRSLSNTTGTGTTPGLHSSAPADADGDTQNILVAHSVSVSHEMHNIPRKTDTPDQDGSLNSGEAPPPHTTVTIIEGTQNSEGQRFEASRMPAAPNVRKMLLMNGYPIAYIILWIPGIANRLAESVGQAPRWLSALQACTQYIGLVNAVTYGMSEQMRRGAWKKLKDPRGRGNH